jgi:S-adenosylmethionine:tRNA ribosyltransferase-isomerase
MAQRDESRLMVLDRAAGTIAHKRFSSIVDLIPADDLLVLNTTRVFRARLLGTRDGSGAPAEVFLLKAAGDGRWEAMVQPGNKLKPGRTVHIADGFDVEVLRNTERGTRIVKLIVAGDVHAAIERHGHIPLPPYITRTASAADAERYQTVYADERGSVAAPTAGLHFTPELLHALEAKGVRRADVLLHVGPGTFKPVEAGDPKDHMMHEEWFRVGDGTAAAVNGARARGSKVWAVGTTSLRTLESVVDANGRVHPREGETDIFIYPPYTVRAADRLVTNFHLPRSTLLMLVMAFAGVELVKEAYSVAVREGYRFYSYGDAMVIL